MDDFTDDFEDDYDGGDDFTEETPEEEHPDEGPVEHEIEEAQFEAPSWESIAFFGAMAEHIAEDEKIEREMKKDEDEDNI
ncbi:MAG: hypothetical protein EHM85_05655 [Desulfobacteraceae bacterium]|nr:MAG: hypothetical protein EHM85_05655 [Desulfobacteraceae bacterium]